MLLDWVILYKQLTQMRPRHRKDALADPLERPEWRHLQWFNRLFEKRAPTRTGPQAAKAREDPEKDELGSRCASEPPTDGTWRRTPCKVPYSAASAAASVLRISPAWGSRTGFSIRAAQRPISAMAHEVMKSGENAAA